VKKPRLLFSYPPATVLVVLVMFPLMVIRTSIGSGIIQVPYPDGIRNILGAVIVLLLGSLGVFGLRRQPHSPEEPDSVPGDNTNADGESVGSNCDGET
jgi:hypothetical protein